VPTDFVEEVARARAAQSKGWLRLLASEVTGMTFQWPALAIVAQAQWDLKDYEATRKTWERVRESDPEQVAVAALSRGEPTILSRGTGLFTATPVVPASNDERSSTRPLFCLQFDIKQAALLRFCRCEGRIAFNSLFYLTINHNR
jgi:hypothetical protein